MYSVLGSPCIDACPLYYYGDTKYRICARCSEHCVTCRGSTSVSCTSCDTGYFMVSNKCLPNCTLIGTHKECILCESNGCAICNDTHCLKCNQNYVLYNSLCITECPDGLFADFNAQSCLECNVACKKCDKIGTQCIQCNNEIGYFQTDSMHTCELKVCMDGYYLSSSYECVKCNYRCAKCANQSYCIKCLYRYIEADINGTVNCFECGEYKKGLIYNESSKKCGEVCGDGLNMRILECDDGNSISGDGCSRICTIESGNECIKRAFDQPDLCRDILPPTFKVIVSNHSQTVTVKFSELIKNYSITPTRDSVNLTLHTGNQICKLEINERIEKYQNYSNVTYIRSIVFHVTPECAANKNSVTH